jgi:TatD DNase family protein
MHPELFFVDTHCHLMLCTQEISTVQPLTSTITSLLEESARHQVTTIVDIGTNLQDSQDILRHDYTIYLPVTVLKVIGLHPDTATESPNISISAFEQLVHQHHANIAGIGECGMDFYRPGYNISWQQQLFQAQIELSIQYDKALVVHSRDCPEATLEVLDRYRQQLSRVVMHCYSYDTTMAHKLADRGWLLGIGGSFTYPKNNSLRQAVKSVGIEHIVLETDAPFLAPQVVRGTRNKPSNIPLIAQAIAQELGLDAHDIAHHTTAQAHRLFAHELR